MMILLQQNINSIHVYSSSCLLFTQIDTTYSIKQWSTFMLQHLSVPFLHILAHCLHIIVACLYKFVIQTNIFSLQGLIFFFNQRIVMIICVFHQLSYSILIKLSIRTLNSFSTTIIIFICQTAQISSNILMAERIIHVQ